MSEPRAEAASPVAHADTMAAARRLLQSARITRPPTPVEDLLAACGLATEKFLLSDPFADRGLPVPLAKARADLRPLVRGMVDVADKVVYIHANLGREQQRFVTLHELGHYYLDWHNALLQTCSEADLSPSARRAWEREANIFAKTCLFQGDRFAGDAARLAFGWRAARALARTYGASLEATAWEFVQARPQPVLLLVATLGGSARATSRATSGEPLLEVRYAVPSRAWRERFGRGAIPAPGAPLPWEHPATRLLLSGSRAVTPAQVSVSLPSGASVAVRAELLCNGHDVLMLAQAL